MLLSIFQIPCSIKLFEVVQDKGCDDDKPSLNNYFIDPSMMKVCRNIKPIYRLNTELVLKKLVAYFLI